MNNPSRNPCKNRMCSHCPVVTAIVIVIEAGIVIATGIEKEIKQKIENAIPARNGRVPIHGRRKMPALKITARNKNATSGQNNPGEDAILITVQPVNQREILQTGNPEVITNRVKEKKLVVTNIIIFLQLMNQCKSIPSHQNRQLLHNNTEYLPNQKLLNKATK